MVHVKKIFKKKKKDSQISASDLKTTKLFLRFHVQGDLGGHSTRFLDGGPPVILSVAACWPERKFSRVLC